MLLSHGSTYYYRVSCGDVQSSTYEFTSWRGANLWKPVIQIYGSVHSTKALRRSALSSDRHPGVILHFDSYSDGDKFSDLIEPVASRIPYILLPGQEQRVPQYGLRFQLPGGEFPLNRDSFRTVIGPVQIIGFNSYSLTTTHRIQALEWLREELTAASNTRRQYPWIIVASRSLSVCVSRDLQDTDCHQILALLRQFDVDLYLVGESPSYVRSVALGVDGKTDTHGVVILGLSTISSLSAQIFPTPELIAKSVNGSSIAVSMKVKSGNKVCIQTDSLSERKMLDQFCMEKSVHTLALVEARNGDLYETHVDITAWLILVILLGTTFSILLLLRAKLYQRLCIYMESEGGPPLLFGKMVPV